MSPRNNKYLRYKFNRRVIINEHTGYNYVRNGSTNKYLYVSHRFLNSGLRIQGSTPVHFVTRRNDKFKSTIFIHRENVR